MLCNASPSTWLIVFARGLIVEAAVFALLELFRTLAVPPPAVLLALSRRFLGLDEGVVVMCSFC